MRPGQTRFAIHAASMVAAAMLALPLAGGAAKAADQISIYFVGCAPPTGFPHCAQKLLFTFAPQSVQNAIGLPLRLNLQPSVSRIRSIASTVDLTRGSSPGRKPTWGMSRRAASSSSEP